MYSEEVNPPFRNPTAAHCPEDWRAAQYTASIERDTGS